MLVVGPFGRLYSGARFGLRIPMTNALTAYTWVNSQTFRGLGKSVCSGANCRRLSWTKLVQLTFGPSLPLRKGGDRCGTERNDMVHCASKIEHMAGGGKFGDGPGPWRDGMFQADRARGVRD